MIIFVDEKSNTPCGKYAFIEYYVLIRCPEDKLPGKVNKMRSSFYVITLTAFASILGGAPSNAMSPEPDINSKKWSIQWYEFADPVKDAEQALENGNTKLLGIATRSPNYPGIDPSKFKSVPQKCGSQFIEGTGDTIRSQSDIKKHQLARLYAEKYNTVVANECLNN